MDKEYVSGFFGLLFLIIALLLVGLQASFIEVTSGHLFLLFILTLITAVGTIIGTNVFPKSIGSISLLISIGVIVAIALYIITGKDVKGVRYFLLIFYAVGFGCYGGWIIKANEG